MIRTRWAAGMLLVAVTLCWGAHAQDLVWVQWSESSGGNGHEYAVVLTLDTWENQSAAAEAHGAHLATVTSEAERNFLKALTTPYYSNQFKYYWIGLFQTPDGDEPGEGWSWVTGEEFDFAPWSAGEPSNHVYSGGEDEDFAATHGLFGSFVDQRGSLLYRAVLERDGEAPPADETAPDISLGVPEPTTLAPPNGATVSVSVTGSAMDADSGLAQCVLVVDDEYDLLDAELDVMPLLQEDGSFALSLDLVATCEVGDADGRRYTIALQAADVAGNVAAPVSQVVVVPPDTTPPVVKLESPEPSVLWPPNGEHEVAVSGQAYDGETGISSLTLIVEDEYGEYSFEEEITDQLDEAGHFSVTIIVGGAVTGRDADGRCYTIKAVAVDAFGNETVSDSITVTASNPGQGRGNGGGNGGGNGNGNGPKK